jgi:hypothetical protein
VLTAEGLAVEGLAVEVPGGTEDTSAGQSASRTEPTSSAEPQAMQASSGQSEP